MRAVFLLMMPSMALATPIQLGHQGRLLDVDGTPVNGTHAVELSLRDGSDAVQYVETFGSLNVSGGFYRLILGLDDDLDSSVLDSPELYVAVRVDGTLLEGRSLLVSSPYAARATVAGHIDLVDTSNATTCDDAGRIVYDTAIGEVRVCTGTVWQTLGVKTILLGPNGRTWSDGSVAQSCAAYLSPSGGFEYVGQTGDGNYRIDVDGSGPLPVATVECDMSGGGYTVFHHNREVRFRSTNSEPPRSLTHPVTYTVPIAVVVAAKNAASDVSQLIRKECRGSVIVDTAGTPYSAWLYPPSATAPATRWPNHATCDLNDDVWREASGTLTNAAYLPVIQIDNGDTGDASEDAYFTLGPLRVR